MSDRYLLISPCRDEAQFMRQTLDAVVSQTVRPAKWVIVDDGSSDGSAGILQEYSALYDWIEVVSRTNRGHRAVGPGVIEAFYAGYATVQPSDFEFVCKLDLDLRLPPRYFETLIARMRADPTIATCSGKAYIETDNGLKNEGHGDDTSIGASKFYRMSSFEAIGGFVREVMWDGIDCHRCRMRGWKALSFDDDPQLRFVHLRPEGSSQKNIISGRIRRGYGQYFMGTGFLFLLVSATNRMREKPYVVGSAAMIWGWVRSAILRKPRYPDLEFRRFLLRYHRLVLLFGKKRAVEMIRPIS